MTGSALAVPAVFLAFCLLELCFTGFWRKPGQRPADGVVEGVSPVMLFLVTQPAIILLVHGGLGHVAPQARDALAGLNVFAAFALFLVFDDMAQYWWHRASHNIPVLYHLHRAHHDGQYMSVRIVYRNNIFYYAMMPGLWLSAVLVYLGLGWVYAVYLPLKQLVIIGAHSDVAWDRRLYEQRWLSPVMWLVERTISTPATHHAHHGRHQSDPATYYKGNYGNFLFFWDVLFGTAKITRSYPQDYGVENLAEAGYGEQLLWPLVTQSGVSAQTVR